MYYYFYSDTPRAIFLSGVYLGVTGNEPKKCDVLSPNAFLEARSTVSPQDCFSFILSSEIIKNPPKDLAVTDLKGAYLLHFKSRCAFSEFKVLKQEKFNDAVATVFLENGVRLSIESVSDFYALTIYDNVESAEIKRLNDKRLIFVSLSLKDFGERIMIFDIGSKIKKLYDKKVTSHDLDSDLVTHTKIKDIKKHVISTTLTFSGAEIIEKDRKITFDKDFSRSKLIDEIIPYAFLEDFLVGDNYLEYLSNGVKEKASSLKDYLGAFLAVIPPPLFRAPEEIGLVYKKAENLYCVEYFIFTIENHLISNLKKLDY